MSKKKIVFYFSSLLSFFSIIFVFLFLFSLHGTITGHTIFVLDEDITAEQIAVIAELAGPGDETKMLSEILSDSGILPDSETGFIIFSGLDSGDTATIKKEDDAIYVQGNVNDAVKIMQTPEYQGLLDTYGKLEIVNGQLVLDETSLVVSGTMTLDDFLASMQNWEDMIIVIPSKGSTGDYLAALAFVGKYGYPLVKDTAVAEWQTLHAIVIGSSSVNIVSKAAIDAGATKEGAYYIYSDSIYSGALLVLSSDNSKDTRTAGKELMKKQVPRN